MQVCVETHAQSELHQFHEPQKLCCQVCTVLGEGVVSDSAADQALIKILESTLAALKGTGQGNPNLVC